MKRASVKAIALAAIVVVTLSSCSIHRTEHGVVEIDGERAVCTYTYNKFTERVTDHAVCTMLVTD